MIKIKLALLLIVLNVASMAMENHSSSIRPDAHAPIGVMGDHIHKKNSGMWSARYMNMSMSDLYSGTKKISDASALKSYTMIPKSMSMSMTMLSTMFAPSDDLTLMAMIGYQSKKMDMAMKMGTSSMSTDGFGDLKLSSIYKLKKENGSQWLLNAGLSLPVGSIDEKKDGNRLPYAMQLGSGSFDLNLGTTYTSQMKGFSYGGQVMSTIRLGGDNDNGYHLGNHYALAVWGQKALLDEWSTSLRGTLLIIEDIKGSDTTLMANKSPSNSTDQGKIVGDIGIGLNYIAKSGLLSGNRVGLEFVLPVYHHTEAVNLVNQSLIVFGIQRAI